MCSPWGGESCFAMTHLPPHAQTVWILAPDIASPITLPGLLAVRKRQIRQISNSAARVKINVPQVLLGTIKRFNCVSIK